MSYKQQDFKPVLPNITDDSMREMDIDEATIKRRAANRGVKGTSPQPPDESEEPVDMTTAKKIMIGILIVVIVILLILLIYQLYKYYNSPTMPCKDKVKPAPKTPDPPKPGVEKVSGGEIPQRVKDLDSDVLSQYVKKGDNASHQRENQDVRDKNSTRSVQHKNMIYSTGNIRDLQDNRIEKIIEEASVTEIIDDDDVPSREDMIREIQTDMDKDAVDKSMMRNMEPEDNVIDDFLADDETESTGSDSTEKDESVASGCNFELTTGKNKGHICGRNVSKNNSKCSRHLSK
jgi:hypothetical protein